MTPSQSANTETSGPSSSSSTRAARRAPSSSARPAVDLGLRRADDDALAGREPVGLEHARRHRLGEHRRGRHAGGGHHVLREGLRALDRRRRARRPEDRDPHRAEHVREPRDERHLGADDDEIDAQRAGEAEHGLDVVGADGVALAESRDARGCPGAAWSSVRSGDCGELPGERVLAATGSDEEDAHGESLQR